MKTITNTKRLWSRIIGGVMIVCMTLLFSNLNPAQGALITLGTGNVVYPIYSSPIGTYYRSWNYQIYYYKGEINAAGQIGPGSLTGWDGVYILQIYIHCQIIL